MVNKGRIHKKIRKFMMISSKLRKSDDESMVIYERELQIVSTESKIIESDYEFMEKLKIEVERDFRNCESRN